MDSDILFGSSASSKGINKFESAMWVTKLGLISMGVAATLFLLKVAIIPIYFGIISNLPSIYVAIRGWLVPPYIFIVFNILVLIIAFSSTTLRSHNNHSHAESATPERNKPHYVVSAFSGAWQEEEEEEREMSTQQSEETEVEEEDVVVVEKEVVSMASFKKPADHPARVFASSNEDEKENQAPEVEEDKEETREDIEDSLDETWNLIMEGKTKSPARQLRKSETWGTPPRALDRAGGHPGQLAEEESHGDPGAWAKKELRKSDTFNDSYSLRREKSMSQDELNRRAEAFIKKFNLEMKLQRQESELRFRETVNRRVYA